MITPCLKQIIQQAEAKLKTLSDSARLDAEYLLCHSLGVARSYCYAWPERLLSVAELADFEALLQRRLQGEPMAYITGVQEFWSLPLQVSPAVLIPRPETELLVEQALVFLQDKPDALVLDLGTGSGAIACALAVEMPTLQIIAVDYDHNALKVAQENFSKQACSQVFCVQSDWLSAFATEGLLADLIVANPPYIDPEHPNLAALAYEPKQALVAADKGLFDLAQIIQNAYKRLRSGGLLLLEHGYDQQDAVQALLQQALYQSIATQSDLAGLARFSYGYKR